MVTSPLIDEIQSIAIYTYRGTLVNNNGLLISDCGLKYIKCRMTAPAQAELLYSLKMTGTDDGGRAPNSVMIFLMYSGGVRSYRILTMFKLGISCHPSNIFFPVFSCGLELVAAADGELGVFLPFPLISCEFFFFSS